MSPKKAVRIFIKTDFKNMNEIERQKAIQYLITNNELLKPIQEYLFEIIESNYLLNKTLNDIKRAIEKGGSDLPF